jgi:uncharacterized protein YlaI
MPHGSLDADLTVDENLALKPAHHYLTKLCKNLLDVSTIGSTSNGPQGSLAATTIMQASLRCKCAILPCESLDVDLTVDENLTLKPSHHYLTKLCKNLLNVSTIDRHPMVHGACLHSSCWQ